MEYFTKYFEDDSFIINKLPRLTSKCLLAQLIYFLELINYLVRNKINY